MECRNRLTEQFCTARINIFEFVPVSRENKQYVVRVFGEFVELLLSASRNGFGTTPVDVCRYFGRNSVYCSLIVFLMT